MDRRGSAWQGLLMLLIGGMGPFVSVASADAPPSPATQSGPVAVTAYSLQLRKVIVKIDPGTTLGFVRTKPDCQYDHILTWHGDQGLDITDERLAKSFNQESKVAGYRTTDAPGSLFDDAEPQTADYQVAGAITRLSVSPCYPWVIMQDTQTVRGDASLTVDWQLYSVLDRKVVYEASTDGTYIADADLRDPVILVDRAFEKAADKLLADPAFHAFFTAQAAKQAPAGPLAPIAVARLKKFNTPLAKHMDAVRSAVVTILVPGAIGSGVIISAEGYVLTDQHVVGDHKFVKVKLVTGRQILGEVLRKDSSRDVALIKVEESGLPALPIRETEPDIGEDVYALGSTLGVYESSLSKGIVSAYRQGSGGKLIQSDVKTLPGNSGGPLMDAYGNIVGLCESGAVIPGAPNAPSGVDFFNPILDSLKALGIHLK